MDELIKIFLNTKNAKNIIIHINFKTKMTKFKVITDIPYVTHNQIKYTPNQIKYTPDSITYPTARGIVNITTFNYYRYKNYLACDLNYYPKLKEEFLITLEKALLL